MSSAVSSRKRKFASLAPLAKTAESYVRRLDDVERELAMVKKIEPNEIRDNRLSLPITWKAAGAFKNNSLLMLTDLGDKENNYAISFKAKRGSDIHGYLTGNGIEQLFQTQSIQADDKLVLLSEPTTLSIMYILFRKDAQPQEKYASSFATFKLRFEAERAALLGVGLPLTDDRLQTYWKVTLGEGNISVHGDRYERGRDKLSSDIDVDGIIQASKDLFDMSAEPRDWDLTVLHDVADYLHGAASRGYKVHKTLSLANTMIIYKEKHSQLLADLTKTEEAVKTLVDRYGEQFIA